jgi:hypothetical protein
MARPLAPLPGLGSKIAIVGTLSDYKPQPFMFMMTRGELAPESMPVAGGPCADPRPQMCTRDYRPACGLHRDGTRKTYGNACSACSKPLTIWAKSNCVYPIRMSYTRYKLLTTNNLPYPNLPIGSSRRQ